MRPIGTEEVDLSKLTPIEKELRQIFTNYAAWLLDPPAEWQERMDGNPDEAKKVLDSLKYHFVNDVLDCVGRVSSVTSSSSAVSSQFKATLHPPANQGKETP